MKKLLFLLLLPLNVMAAPAPIHVDEAAYPLVLIGQIELNYQPPHLWLRFITGSSNSARTTKYCYKINPATPPAETNGWVSLFYYWLGGPWTSHMQPMTPADQARCWQ